jgi:pyruvate/2-oxoglutarate dehydrogenase complex dihydrolipoamide dehydrogenase (E3) component
MKLMVLGGGPAGVSAALHARELGAEVTLVESGQVGGTSVNSGPAPVRTLARAARLMRDTKSWERFGLHGTRPEVDIAAVHASARRVADLVHHHYHVAEALRRHGIELVEGAGPAVFADPHTVELPDGRKLAADATVIAVGGHPARPPIPGVEHALTYENLRDITALPASVAVIGGADTGCQLASILADMDVDVTLIEASPILVPNADRDVSEALAESFKERGITVLASTLVQQIERTPSGVTASYLTAGQEGRVDTDAVFLAVGWPGNIDTMRAAEIGLGTDRGYVTVDETLRSNLGHILAAGDVNGLSMLAPSARIQGRVAAENAVLGTRRRFTAELVPTGSFTDPEYGGVGLSEDAARQRYDCEVAVAWYRYLMRPIVDDRPVGFCKLIVERNRRYILGAHVLGEYSAEVVQTAAACMAANLRIEQVADLQPAFPTFTEGISVAAQMIVRQMGIAPTAPTWGELRESYL